MSTFTNTLSRKKKQRILYLGIDVPFLICVIALLSIGLLMVYSAGWDFSVTQLGENPSYLFIRQLRFVVLGSSLAILAFIFGYKRLKKFIVTLMVLNIILLLSVIIFVGETRLGAQRALFNGSIQPSEFSKLILVVYLSFWLNSKQEQLNKFSFGLLPMIGILGITSGLIMLQPDISAAATIMLIGGIMFFLGGGELRQITFILGIAIIIGLIIVFLVPTGKLRLAEFISGIQDPLNASYHVKRSIEAIVRGGTFGVGIGRATTKFTGLPVAPTDSIYAVIAEETGLIGASSIVVLFLVFLWRGLTIANNAPDLLGKLIAAGITVWIFTEAMINICVMVSLLPFAGNALPFISAGGSSMVTVLSGVGLIMSVARATAIKKNKEEGRPLDEIVDLRRDDRRRRVSRARCSASAWR
ncbi:MAG TPA: FtsW/RodA/SpoVE family cell cycle protein [Anaerolineae bacterium]|nr:FtsW/RodA/SpoVE family cell cycle protein [Anaerolineae bacterium]